MAPSQEDIDRELFYAARDGHVHTVEVLVSIGGNLSEAFDYPLWFNRDDNTSPIVQMTPLMIAAYCNRFEAVEKVIDLGGEVDFTLDDGGGKTALMFAAYRNRVDSIRVLLERGASVSLRVDGYNALDMAVNAGSVDAVRSILVFDPIIDAESSLHLAIASGQLEIVTVFTSHLPFVSFQIEKVKTLVDVALSSGNRDMVRHIGSLFERCLPPSSPQHQEEEEDNVGFGQFVVIGDDEEGQEVAVRDGIEHLAVESDHDDSEMVEPRPCTVCHVHTPRIRFDPCGHMACNGCSDRILQNGGSCHMCRATVSGTQRVFL